MGVKSKIRDVIWGKPPRTKEERRLVFKIDLLILTFVCFTYWVNYLDRMNLSNAYVSGLKDDLKMHGTEFNQINSGSSSDSSKTRSLKEALGG